MFRIRRIYDDTLEIDRKQILRVQAILREQFPLVPEKDIQKLPDVLRNPLRHRFRPILLVAEDLHKTVLGFALVLHAPTLNFFFLDYISSAKQTTGKGIGGALYERVREEALSLNVIGIFLECLPDDPQICQVPEILKQNADRLRFYEKYGARPVIGTLYETPIKAEDRCPPFLVYDDLGRGLPLRRGTARMIVRAILERKYGEACPPGYVELVVLSFKDDPVRLRGPRHIKPERMGRASAAIPSDRKIRLVVHEGHSIHHIKERGYVESPVRIQTILREIEPTQIFERVKVRRFSDKHILQVHDHSYVQYFKKICQTLEPGESVYPYVFPIRNQARPPKELAIRAGYYCIDTFTPLSREAYSAAKGAVDCALSAALTLIEGYRLAYALVRPPGHHAERRTFGGFCYFNSTSIAAFNLSRWGKVAILDIDYHHGNGHQDIFYRRNDVLTISIHGHPRFAYPFFSGFEEEKGEGLGKGYNINYPLKEKVDGPMFRETLRRAMTHIRLFRPSFLVVALGLDTAKDDPTGTWSLMAKDFELHGGMIGSLRLPTLVVQEGGYNTRNLGINARHFFLGLWRAAFLDVPEKPAA
jgi:acetoin utilization deacetylase AcuC-like enzyme/GNAT superfamily N-acetyltransferase